MEEKRIYRVGNTNIIPCSLFVLWENKDYMVFYIIGNFDKFPIIQKALQAGCARRNKEILPLCGIAAARKVDKPLKSEGQES